MYTKDGPRPADRALPRGADLDPLNHRHLQCFWSVAQEGSLTGAARQLGLATSTVSAQISALEAELGVALLHRHGRSVSLTDAGRLVEQYAADILGLGRELVALLDREALGEHAPRVHVGVAHELPKLVTFRLLQALLQEVPAAHLVVHHGSPEQLAADLQTRRLELVLTDGPLQLAATAPVRSTVVGSSALCVVAAEPLAAGLGAGFPASLDGAPFLLPTAGSTVRRSLDAWLAEVGVRPRVVGEFDDSGLLKVFGSHGLGAFVVPEVVSEEVQARYGARALGLLGDARVDFLVTELVSRPRPALVAALVRAA